MRFDDVSSFYRANDSLRQTAMHFGISEGKCRKILITTGDYRSPRTDEILRLVDAGLSLEDISRELSIGISAINAHLPYSKGEYNVDQPTVNAQRIRRHRDKIAANDGKEN